MLLDGYKYDIELLWVRVDVWHIGFGLYDPINQGTQLGSPVGSDNPRIISHPPGFIAANCRQ